MKKIFLIFVSCVLVVSCGGGRRHTATLQKLNRTIAERQIYIDRFEAKMDSLKRAFPDDACDSLLWEHAYEMYEIYRYYSIDTVRQYITLMETLVNGSRSADKDQCSLTTGAKVRYMRSVTEDMTSMVETFESMDTVGLRKSTVRKWYSVGVTLYMAVVDIVGDGAQRLQYEARLKQLRKEYEDRFFDYSVHCRIMTAIAYRDYGDYDKAMSILTAMSAEEDLTLHERTQVLFYLATLYRLQGDYDKYKELLISTAEAETRIPVRDYHALYELAMLLYQEGEVLDASRLIAVVYSDALAINFYSRLHRSSQAQNIIANSAYESERQRVRLTSYFIIVLVVVIIVVSALLFYSLRQRRKLYRAYAELKDANLIKDNYVLRYMKLSSHYIRQVDETRNLIRRTAKSGGLDAVMTLLRSPRYTDEEYKRFYKIFDDTFVSLFPHFVSKVNEIMPADNQLSVKPDGGLNTEIRILAIIRLGITKSPEIAQVLNCSVNTVYKYRETLRHKALCPKEDFEKIIKRIDF